MIPEQKHNKELNFSGVFLLSIILSVLMLFAMLYNRWEGTTCIEWKITAAALSVFAVSAPFFGRNSMNFRSFFFRSLGLFFMLIADAIIYIFLISRCTFMNVKFHVEFLLFPLLVFLLFSFLINRKILQ